MPDTPTVPGFKIRFQVRLSNPLTSDDERLPLTINGYPAEIRPRSKGAVLRDSSWVLFTIKGFDNEQEARDFSERLSDIVSLACFSARLGVDVGNGTSSSWVDEEFSRKMGFVKPHERVAQNIHGVMILPDDDLTRIPIFEVEANVTSDPIRLIQVIENVSSQRVMIPQTCRSGLKIMNSALMQRDHLARIILGVSAIEEMGKTLDWSKAQANALKSLVEDLTPEIHPGLSLSELEEIKDAVSKLHKVSLRQGVKRLLNHYGCSDIMRKWDELYSKRSGVVHGTGRLNTAELGQLSEEIIALCGQIIARIMKSEGVLLPQIATESWQGVH